MVSFRALATPILIAAVTVAPWGQAAAKGPSLPALESFTTFVLDNGLTVSWVRMDTAPVVSVQLWYRAGSKDERRDRRGSAHMFEHMMFKGSAHVRAEAHAQSINGLGGSVNATTDEDATHYTNTLPADHMDYAIQLEAERMRNLLFRKDMIAIEREVVKEEIRRQENSPITKGFLRFLEIAFTKHPYAWTAGGTIKDLDVTTPEDLKAFYDTYYQPNNAHLVIVGKVSLDDVKASTQKWFGKIPKGAEPPRPSKAPAAQEVPQTAKRHEVVEPNQIGLCLVGFHIPAAGEVVEAVKGNPRKEIHAIQIATLILGTGESSRLKQRLEKEDPKTKQRLSVQSGMETFVRADPGLTVALGAFFDPNGAAAIETAILDEIAKLGKTGPTADELRKAKNQVQSGFMFSLERAEGLAEAIGRSWILGTSFVNDIEEIEKVSAADVQRVVKRYMTPELATTVIIPPKARAQ